ncbi:MAG: hypothetical protein HFG20_08490 [Anaerotruncus sp.]|nr:hypothetical protein [Anaerotruncus sp.]
MAVKRKKGVIQIQTAPNRCMAIAGMEQIRKVEPQDYACWLACCAELVQPCAHTISEVEEYLHTLCDLRRLPPEDVHLCNFKAQRIISKFGEQLTHRPPEFSPEMTDAQLEAWEQETFAQRQEAMQIPPERFGLIIWGYALPKTTRNAPFYADVLQQYRNNCQRFGRETHEAQLVIPEPLVFFEGEENISVNGGGDLLIQQIYRYYGISEQDIIQRSPRFQIYCDCLRKAGELPPLTEGER